jgi:hypothetical protein
VGDLLKAVDEAKNEQEDIEYFEQQLLFNGGVLPSQIEDENMMELLKVQQARNRDDRPMPSADAHAKLRGM